MKHSELAETGSKPTINEPTIDEPMLDRSSPTNSRSAIHGLQTYEIEGLHYRFVEIPTDGNCLFHALKWIPAVPFGSANLVREAVISY
jgi:hypothetical protein